MQTRRASRKLMALMLALLIAVGAPTFAQQASAAGHGPGLIQPCDPGGGSGGGGHM